MKQSGVELKRLLQDSYYELQKRYENNDQDMGLFSIKTVEIELNSVFNFFEKGGVYELFGATPQENRVALMQISIANIAKYKVARNVLIFFRKTNVKDWVMFLLSYTSGVPLEKMRRGDFDPKDWRSLAEASGDLSEVGVTVYEGEYVLDDFIAYCKNQYDEGVCFDVLIIDGLSPQETNDLEEGGKVREALSGLAKDLQASIITSTATYRGWQEAKLGRVC